MTSASTPQTPNSTSRTVGLVAPVADRREHVREHHGERFNDPYEWLRDKGSVHVLAHLEAENSYAEAATAHLEELRQELFDDIRSRTLETDLSVPNFITDEQGRSWWYYSRMVSGRDYPVLCRVPATSRDDLPDLDALAASQSPDGEEVLLDGNAEAEGHEFFSLGAGSPSPNGDLFAFSVDHRGDERFDLYVRDLTTGVTTLAAFGVFYRAAWAGDDRVLYTQVDDAWRPHQVWLHTLGTTPDDDELLFEEPDERFWVGVDESRDRRWLVIHSASTLTSEALVMPSQVQGARPRVVTPRHEGIDHSIEVASNGELFVLHNATSPDFEISTVPLSLDPEKWSNDNAPLAPRESWRPWLGPTDGVRYSDIDVYDDFVVVSRRRDGLAGLDVVDRHDPAQVRSIAFPEPVHEASPVADEDPATDRIRVHYESLVTPAQVLELRLATGELTVLRSTPVLDHPQHGPYRPDDYISERQWAVADDGRRIPLSIVRRRDTPLDGTAPCLLYGYGAYEVSIPPSFVISRLSLLDRGFVYAIAHVRGGGEMGRAWYDEGKQLAKKHSFSDFVTAGRWLVEHRYTSADRMVAEGRSAGGLLMGGITNLAPDLFCGVHAGVAFVDALTTILNPELPLTVTEWEEWGNPLSDPEVYAYMKSYTPYENIRAERYPAILATTSLNDTRVLFVEPAKWVQELRHTTITDPDRPVLLRTEMVAGHGGVTGRYAKWRDRAFELAWIIDTATRSQQG